MAEFVNERVERTVWEYERIKQRNLLTEDEIKQVKTSRGEFELKLTSSDRTVTTFFDYIRYEKALLRRLVGFSKEAKASNKELINSMNKRVVNLYRQAIEINFQDAEVWKVFLKFCKNNGLMSELETALERVVNHLGHHASMWLKVALVTYNDLNNVNKARQIFLRALKIHESDKPLYLNFFELELKQQYGKNDSESEVKTEKSLLDVLFDNVTKTIHDLDFYIDLIGICEKYDGSDKFQLLIIDFLTSKYTNDAAMYNLLAEREARGYHMYNAKNGDPFQKELNTNNKKKSVETSEVAIQRAKLGVSVFRRALTAIRNEQMYNFYAEMVLKMYSDPNLPTDFKNKILDECMQEAHDFGMLSAKHYVKYVEILTSRPNHDHKVSEYMDRCLELHPDEVASWELQLRYRISQNDEEKVMQLFRRAQKQLDSKSVPLWRLSILFNQLRNPTKANVLLKEAATKSAPEFAEFRIQYVEWNAVFRSIEDGRRAYDDVASLTPHNIELHRRMAYIESTASKPNVHRWRKVYLNMVNQFGETDTSVWIEYICFERSHSKEPKNLSKIYDLALHSLVNQLDADKFISEYNLVLTKVI